jgi:quercetin dioxygenase-like cupin family protein
MQSHPIDLAATPVHLSGIHKNADPSVVLEGFNFDGESFGQYIARYSSDESPGRIVMIESSPADWTTWERHTQGEEIVVVLSGAGEFIQEIDGVHQRIPLVAGTAIINPSGVWHTADITAPLTALYITPCPGTEHKPR